MGIEVVTGLPGSGKTTFVVETVNKARETGRPVLLFMCSDAREFSETSSIRRFKRISTRSALTCAIDHLVPAAEARDIVAGIPATPRQFLVFDEAQYFGRDFTAVWKLAAEAGHDVLISTPTPAQIKDLTGAITKMQTLETQCILMGDGPAKHFFVLPNSSVTLSVCDSCAAVLGERAKATALDMLIKQDPHPGEERVYQPVDIAEPEFQRLKPIRSDCGVRVEIMTEHIKKHLGTFAPRSLSYIDMGCNTGYFCKKMADLGFVSHGVDVVPGDIRLAKLLDTYFYRRYINFVAENAVTYIKKDTATYDVVSTFSVFQWIYLQQGKEAAEGALLKYLGQAKSLVFFEMGYVDEAHYKGRLDEQIDKAWCKRLLEKTGRFSEIITYDQGQRGLKRDFFVAVVKK